jgi:hypothetical protein
MEQGEEDAAHRLWDRYSGDMLAVARRRMQRLKQRDIVDEDDIVISAFATVCLAARKGQLKSVLNRTDLWGLMVVATLQKIGQRVQYVDAGKRNSDLVLGQAEGLDEFGSRLERLVHDAPGPQSEVMHQDLTEQLLARLPNADLRAVAVLRLAGHTNEEIASELGFTRRTIQRMLNLIRLRWDDLRPTGSRS